MSHSFMVSDEIASTGKSMDARAGTLQARQAWKESLGMAPLKAAAFILSLSVGIFVWQIPPPDPLDANGMRFLATLAAAVILWIFDVFDEYIVGLLLLLSWLLLDVVPPRIALSGYSTAAWFFTVGALGMGAAIGRSGVLNRAAQKILARIPPDYKIYSWILTLSGPFVTAFLPEVKARVALVSPLTQAISTNIGLVSRSNGSAGLGLSSYVGYTQVTFTFLTGSTYCLVGWSLMPEAAKSEFGWTTWVLAALPAALVVLFFLTLSIQVLFPPTANEKEKIRLGASLRQVSEIAPMTGAEQVSSVILLLAVVGWAAKPLHGVSEAWVALAGLLAFLMTGVLDKKSLKDNVDWAILLFFGVIYGMGPISSSLQIDRWLIRLLRPILDDVLVHPLGFLLIALLFVYVIRFFLAKAPAVILASLVLTPFAQEGGIHPGVLLLTVLLGVEVWFLPYQNPSYLVAYQIVGGKAFSHRQARQLMAVKFLVSFLAVAISVPYWSWLGFIEPKSHAAMERLVGADSTAHADEAQLDTSVAKDTHPGLGVAQNRVASIQRLLQEFGYDPGPIDGILGSRTIQAIQKYQRETGLEVHGRPSRTLEAHLRKRRSTE